MSEFFKQVIKSLTTVIKSHSDFNNHLQITIAKENILKVIQQLKHLNGRLLTMVGNDERELVDSFNLYYVFAFDQEQSLITVKLSISEEDPSFPSVTNKYPAFNWYEREVHDLLGLKPVGHPDDQPLLLLQSWPKGNYPLRKDYPVDRMQEHIEAQDWFTTTYEGEAVTQVPVGPIHAGIIEPGHFRFGVAGDMILHLDAQLFFKHRGLEKKTEGKSLTDTLFIAERICGMCTVSHAVAYAQAVEQITGTIVPRRAVYLRMLYLELERLYNHIGDIGDICSGAGFHFGTVQGARLKEQLQQLNEQVTGHRFLRGVIALGGVRRELKKHEADYIHTKLTNIKRDFRELINIILDHEITLDRMATTGYLTNEMANDYEVVGPAARASGRKVDIRKSHPYLAYDQLTFDIPLQEKGDVLSRVNLRIDEVFISFSLIQQILEKLPNGDLMAKLGNVKPYKIGLGWTESALGENVHWVMTGPDATIYRYRIRSAAYSNWPAVPQTVVGNIVPDFPIINKSFELCYACCDR